MPDADAVDVGELAEHFAERWVKEEILDIVVDSPEIDPLQEYPVVIGLAVVLDALVVLAGNFVAAHRLDTGVDGGVEGAQLVGSEEVVDDQPAFFLIILYLSRSEFGFH